MFICHSRFAVSRTEQVSAVATESCCRQSLTITVINYSGRTSKLGYILSFTDRRKASVLCPIRLSVCLSLSRQEYSQLTQQNAASTRPAYVSDVLCDVR